MGFAMEVKAANEEKLIARMAQGAAAGVTKAFEGTDVKVSPATRDQHPKHHGVVRAAFVVLGDLPQELRAGVFAEPKTFGAWVRFSNGKAPNPLSGAPQADSLPDVRGMAVKLVGVAGPKLLDDERGAETQDFVLMSHPVFFIKDVADYLAFISDMKGFLGTHPAEAGIVGSMMSTIRNPLHIQYWGTVPSLLGGKAMKFSARPAEIDPLPAPAGFPEDGLRHAMAETLSTGGVKFDFLVQVQTNPDTMSIEDSTKPWSEAESPFVKVAEIRIGKQEFCSGDQMSFCENLSYTPWHSIAEHRPLGGINRARKDVYQQVSEARHKINGVRREEPTLDESWSGMLNHQDQAPTAGNP